MTRALAVLLLAARVASAGTFTFVRTIQNPKPAAADFFGSSVALTGVAIAIGSRFDDAAGANAGAAQLFDLSSGALLRTFAPPAQAAGDQLGFAIAPLGADFLVSAPEHDSGAARGGIIYRFSPAADAPVQSYSKPADGAKLGYAVATLGGNVVAGAPFENGSGAAYLFDGGSGALLQTYLEPVPTADDSFGRAVAGVGSMVAVSAPFDDTNASNAGVVHLYDGASGAFLRTLTAPLPRPNDNFGLALAADGTQLLVGCPYDHTTAAASGAAYLFDAGTGTLLRTFLSPAPDGRFGAAVALSGNLALIGAPYADGDFTDTGKAFVYDVSSGALVDTLESPSPRSGDQFGAAVAFAGSQAIVGAWLDDTGAPSAGAVFQWVNVTVPTTSSTTSTSTSVTSTTSTSVTTTTSTSTTSTSATTTTSSSVDSGSTQTPSSTTTTVSASETTLGPPPSETTTTTSTLPGGPCAGGCDDGNPCTTDACVDGTCRNDPLTGIDAVTCRLDMIDVKLHTSEPALLGGPRLALRLQRKVARARVLIDAARKPGAPVRKFRVAVRILGGFIKVVRNGQRVGRIGHAIADDLLALSTNAAADLQPLL